MRWYLIQVLMVRGLQIIPFRKIMALWHNAARPLSQRVCMPSRLSCPDTMLCQNL